MTTRKPPTLSADELDRVFSLGYSIRGRWISPREGIEYHIYYMGGSKVLAFRKSERAAYNFILKHSARIHQ